MPGCAIECKASKTARLIAVGTKGRGVPVETSQMMLESAMDKGTAFSTNEVDPLVVPSFKCCSSRSVNCIAAMLTRSTPGC